MKRKSAKMKKGITCLVLFMILMSTMSLSVVASDNNLTSTYINLKDGPEPAERLASAVTISNEYLTMTIYSDGNFKGTNAIGECIFFPGATSDLTIKIGSHEYNIGGTLSNYRTKDTYINPNNDKEAITEWVLPEGIHVEQHIKLEGDHVAFTVKARNNEDFNQDVSVRYLWDTQLCDNDGSPLKAKGTLYIKEMCFEPVDFDHWCAYSRPEESEAKLVTYGWWADMPDKMIFAHWPNAIGSVYSYNWNPNRQFYTPGYLSSPESDSCVLMYWENMNIPANGEKSVTSYYGTTIQAGLTLSMKLDKTEYNPNEMMKIYVKAIDADGNNNYPLTQDNTEVRIDENDINIEDIIPQPNGEYLIKVKSPSDGGDHTLWVQVVTDQGYASAEKAFIVRRIPVINVYGYFPLPQSYRTLCENLKAHGYETGRTLFGISFEPPSYPSGSSIITGYAGELSDKVNEVKQTCDVDKVDIIAHDMGGLVARWHIEKMDGGETVRKLIMLGTPNKGAVYFSMRHYAKEIMISLAKAVITAGGGVPFSFVFHPPLEEQMRPGSKFIDDLNSNPTYTDVSTTYFTIAGDKSVWYAWPFLLFYPHHENDRIVRTVEVELEGIPLEIYHVDHTELCTNDEVLHRIVEILENDPDHQISSTFMQARQQVPIQLAPTISDKLLPGEQRLYEVEVTATTEATFTLAWTEGDLNLTLTTPSGTLIDPSAAESEPNITYYQESNITAEEYIVETPEAGTWQVNVSAVDVPEEGEDYIVMTFLESPITLSLDLAKPRYHPGEEILIKAELKSDAAPLTGASVTAEIKRPDGSIENTTLYDDGSHNDEAANDGIYANPYTNTSLWGNYDVTVTASGTVDDEQFAREAFAVVWVEQYPDLTLSDSDIYLSNNNPDPGEEITINATIHNVGEADAHNTSILFYAGDPATNGILAGEDVIDVEAGDSAEACIEWTAVEGVKEICVLVSPYNEFLEQDYTNNRACAQLLYPDIWIDILTSQESIGIEQHTSVIETLTNEPCNLTVYIKNTGAEALHNVQILTNVGVIEDVGDFDEGEVRQVPIEFTPTIPGLSALNVTVKSDEIEKNVTRTLLIEKFDFTVSIPKTQYDQNEPVPINISITNEVPNMRFIDTKIEINISNSNFNKTFEIPLLSLGPMVTKNTTFTWDTTGVNNGAYTIVTSLVIAEQEVLSDEKNVYIGTEPPIANANGPYTGVIEYIAVPITFDGTGSYDPDGTIVKYAWDLDNDGEFDDAVGATPTVSFTAPGIGNIHLKVTDNNGATDTDTTTLTITKHSPPPNGIHGGLLTPPEQPQCYSGTSTIQGKGYFTIDERIQDWATAIDTTEHIEGTGEFAMDSKTVLDQAANPLDFYDPNFYHKKTMQFQGNATNRLLNRETFESSGIFGGTGTRVSEYFDVSMIQKDESSSIKTISAPGSGQSHRFATMDDFSGIWGIHSDWQKICQKDIRHHQMFMGNFSVQKDLTFEREVGMP